uniref:distal tail protein Dit n=1 Tax=uncultured Allobacillus sp. TaxID=1638025 RepID=UPI002593D094|nr:distal tail protein Dit [uncultured Allobacillus sp.]
MLFNGIDLSPYMRIKDIRGRGLINRRVNAITAPGMDGEYSELVETPAKLLEVEARITGVDLRATIDDLNGILATDEPVPIVFPDEPEKTYYGIVEESSEDGELIHLNRHDATFIIRRSDPYKYGPEQSINFTSDTAIINNEGTAEAKPVIELTAKEPVTFAMVSNGDEYNLVGTPADDDVQIVDAKTTVLYENGSTIDDWQDASMDMVDDPNVSNIGGNLGSDGAGIRANPYGPSGSGQRGGAKTKELDEGLQDFELETTFDIISRREIENWRMMIYLHDENLNPIGQLGLKDNSRNYKRRVPLGTAGPHSSGYGNGRVLGDRSRYNDNARDTTLFYLRMKREDNVFSFYVGEWYNFRHINTWSGDFKDKSNQYMGKVKYITLFVGSYQDRPIPSRIRMNSVELFELTSVAEDQTPYIARAGDVFTFDHENRDVLLNGEAIAKQIGGDFFTLKKDENTLALMPEGAFDGQVRYRSRYR